MSHNTPTQSAAGQAPCQRIPGKKTQENPSGKERHVNNFVTHPPLTPMSTSMVQTNGLQHEAADASLPATMAHGQASEPAQLSDAQRARMERNRQLALERRQARVSRKPYADASDRIKGPRLAGQKSASWIDTLGYPKAALEQLWDIPNTSQAKGAGLGYPGRAPAELVWDKQGCLSRMRSVSLPGDSTPSRQTPAQGEGLQSVLMTSVQGSEGSMPKQSQEYPIYQPPTRTRTLLQVLHLDDGQLPKYCQKSHALRETLQKENTMDATTPSSDSLSLAGRNEDEVSNLLLGAIALAGETNTFYK
ncbi:Hypp5755 [Branchiostoma lanceolatum]|uniref:Hypp5755 protein n=1 Tax=Branchiostoma lanceolatum TaxID=7740 RepID=A0A8J9YNU6_BRALA|nr:Hypp5755 [Branchiostoma lanceolatum]